MVKHEGMRDYICFLRDLHGFGPEDVSILTIPSEAESRLAVCAVPCHALIRPSACLALMLHPPAVCSEL